MAADPERDQALNDYKQKVPITAGAASFRAPSDLPTSCLSTENGTQNSKASG